ncbi:MAG: hypothetical protein WC661_08740 [Opitutaceae bacterium]|jgi:drug/metabolite transporter (DMT)-like permease
MPLAIAPLLATLTLSLMCAAADFALKRASQGDHPFRSPAFILGAALYLASAYGWIYVFRHVKLATIGAVFSIVLTLLLAVIGVVAFRESLSAREITGLACAIAALALLSKFS